MKKRPIEATRSKALVTINTTKTAVRFAVPVTILKQLQQELAQFAIHSEEEASVPWREVFSDLIGKSSESGVMLRASRKEAALTQIELARKLGIPQSNLSAMETGKLAIGRIMAKRLAVIFKTDYRLFT